MVACCGAVSRATLLSRRCCQGSSETTQQLTDFAVDPNEPCRTAAGIFVDTVDALARVLARLRLTLVGVNLAIVALIPRQTTALDRVGKRLGAGGSILTRTTHTEVLGHAASHALETTRALASEPGDGVGTSTIIQTWLVGSAGADPCLAHASSMRQITGAGAVGLADAIIQTGVDLDLGLEIVLGAHQLAVCHLLAAETVEA